MNSDSWLVKEAIDGDAKAFEELVRRYQRSSRAVAMSVLHEQNAAADASQQAFLNAYENLRRLRRPGAFGSWLMMITKRCALDIVKRQKNIVGLEVAEAKEYYKPNGQLDDDKKALLFAVSKLPKTEKHLILLRHFSQMPVKDIAESLGRSTGTITKQLSRAHDRLRKIYKEVEK